MRFTSVPTSDTLAGYQRAADFDFERFEFPLGRVAQPGEVSNMVLYLASDESSYSTGSEFVVDGGLTMGGISTRGSNV